MAGRNPLVQECRERQDDEIVALKSIYSSTHDASDEEASDGMVSSLKGDTTSVSLTEARVNIDRTSHDPVVQLSLPVKLPEPTKIVIESAYRRSTSEKLATDDSKLKRSTQLPPLSHLPPVFLQVRLPELYPHDSAPVIEKLQAPWLDQEDEQTCTWLEEKLKEQFNDSAGVEILWTWATWLSEGLWSDLLDGTPDSDDAPFVLHDGSSSSARLCFKEKLVSPDATPLLPATLLSYSRQCTRTTFDSTIFDCGICLETRKGKACTRLAGCSHVFCSDCLKSYLSMLVEEGFHRQAKRCPDPDCVKMWGEREKNGEIDQIGEVVGELDASKVLSIDQTRPSKASSQIQSDSSASSPTVVQGLVSLTELEGILTQAQLKRLDDLTIKARMEADPSVSYCPREGCGSAVVRSSADEGSGHWERFRECSSCGFTFCAWCSRSWHGPTSCPISFQTGLIQEYMALAPGSAAQLAMQQKFGRKTLESLVQKYEEEQQTKKWLQDFTTPCPSCGISIEKSYGCNHMTCKSCLTHYCYLCGKSISGSNPYSHFNTLGSACYNRLFDGLLGQQGPEGIMVGPDGIPVNAEDLIPWEELV